MTSTPRRALCEDEQTKELSWGSPLVALQVSDPFDIYFFNDLDHEAIEALTMRVERVAPRGSAILSIDLEDEGAFTRARAIGATASLGPKIIISRGDANKAPLFIQELMPQTRMRYTLALIDPQHAIFHWDALETLSMFERSFDLLTLFPDASDLARGLAYYLNRPRSGEKLDAYFGTKEWRAIARNEPRRAEHALREFYESRMETYLGMKIGKPKGVGFSARPLYHLVFGAKHKRGVEIWNDANKRAPWVQDELLFDL